MLVRKQSGNQEDFFDKSFSLYQQGFSANGEFQKMTNDRKKFPRRGLDRPGQASPTDQCKILLAEDHHEGLPRRAIHSSF